MSGFDEEIASLLEPSQKFQFKGRQMTKFPLFVALKLKILKNSAFTVFVRELEKLGSSRNLSVDKKKILSVSSSQLQTDVSAIRVDERWPIGSGEKSGEPCKALLRCHGKFAAPLLEAADDGSIMKDRT